MVEKEVRRGAGIYSKSVLSFYDLLVVRFSNSQAWRCPSQQMLEQYNRCIGARHLDVGPGTGWYLANAELPADVEITLMDLNVNSLDRASARLGNGRHRALIGDVLQPLPADSGRFDSIGMNYVLHCVPGTWADKGAAFGNLADRLTDDGVLFGSTILGDGVGHNAIGHGLMTLYNGLGIFHNRQDDAAGLKAALERSFTRVDVDVVGTVAMFQAGQPRRRVR